jgi:hypothetical protein
MMDVQQPQWPYDGILTVLLSNLVLFSYQTLETLAINYIIKHETDAANRPLFNTSSLSGTVRESRGCKAECTTRPRTQP